MTTTTKAIILGLILSVVPAVADAKTHKNTYPYKVHTSVHFYCPYKGCKSSFKKY